MGAAEELTIAGIGLVVFVTLVMELAKRIWPALQDQKAIAATVVVGVASAYAAYGMQWYPGFARWATPLVVGLAVAAAASGVYSWTKKRG